MIITEDIFSALKIKSANFTFISYITVHPMVGGVAITLQTANAVKVKMRLCINESVLQIAHQISILIIAC